MFNSFIKNVPNKSLDREIELEFSDGFLEEDPIYIELDESKNIISSRRSTDIKKNIKINTGVQNYLLEVSLNDIDELAKELKELAKGKSINILSLVSKGKDTQVTYQER